MRVCSWCKGLPSSQRYIFWPLPFSVVVDGGLREGPFLPVPVENLSPRAPVPVLLGMVPEEGMLFALGNIANFVQNKYQTCLCFLMYHAYLISKFHPYLPCITEHN